MEKQNKYKEVAVKISDNKHLICRAYENCEPGELSIFISDKNGDFKQDICLVRENYRTNDYGGYLPPDNSMEILVWANEEDEDYTDVIEIDKRRDKEQEKLKAFRKLCYQLYKVDWEYTHLFGRDSKMDAIKNFFEETHLAVDGSDDYSYEEYIEQFGYNGEFYVSFDEFCTNEYLEEEYIRKLLDNKALIELYEKDLAKNFKKGYWE